MSTTLSPETRALELPATELLATAQPALELPATAGGAGGPAHEQISVTRGARSGAAIFVALHSTQLGPALGGCRLWTYDSWNDALADALRLSAGMTAKNALAGLNAGGGKTVVRLADNRQLSEAARRDIFLDVGDAVEGFGGRYITAEDVGASARDMATVAERTAHVVGLPMESGGLGDPGAFTARGVHSSVTTMLRWMTGSADPSGTRITIAGLGQVGSRLASTLAEAGATLTVTDFNPARREFADSIGATWVASDAAHRVQSDIFVPAGVGGMLSRSVIEELTTRAVVGPANNQLAEDDGAAQLAARGILYAPDYLVNAGGVIYLNALSQPDADRDDVLRRIDAIGVTLHSVLTTAAQLSITTLAAADALVARRLGSQAR